MEFFVGLISGIGTMGYALNSGRTPLWGVIAGMLLSILLNLIIYFIIRLFRI